MGDENPYTLTPLIPPENEKAFCASTERRQETTIQKL